MPSPAIASSASPRPVADAVVGSFAAAVGAAGALLLLLLGGEAAGTGLEGPDMVKAGSMTSPATGLGCSCCCDGADLIAAASDGPGEGEKGPPSSPVPASPVSG